MQISNQQILTHRFLGIICDDDYYPAHLVDRGKSILLRLCSRIEAEHPADLAALYTLTHIATEEFNILELEFDAAESEIETVAREAIGDDFWFVATTYGFRDADPEELISPRNW